MTEKEITDIRLKIKNEWRELGMICSKIYFFVKDAHTGQVDKGGEEYCFHPFRVGETASKKYGHLLLQTEPYLDSQIDYYQQLLYEVKLEFIGDLHDILEDTKYTLDDLKKMFKELTPDILDALVCLNHKQNESYLDEYIPRIQKNLLAVCVKLTDIEDNMDITRLNRELDETDLKRLNKYLKARKMLLNTLDEQRKYKEKNEPLLMPDASNGRIDLSNV